MQPAIDMSETPPARRGRLPLILMLVMVIGPMVLATAMYQWRFWVPQERTYHGVLIGNGQSRVDLGIEGVADVGWQLLVTAPDGCRGECRQLVYLARQLNIGLGREASRASHALATAGPLDADYEARLRREYPQLGIHSLDLQRYARSVTPTHEAQLWIVDPLGNLVLRYDSSTPGKAILEDLRLLLKLSRIG